MARLPQIRVRKRPEEGIDPALALGRRVEEARIGERSEPCPWRSMHHVVIREPSDLEAEVKALLREECEFGGREVGGRHDSARLCRPRV